VPNTDIKPCRASDSATIQDSNYIRFFLPTIGRRPVGVIILKACLIPGGRKLKKTVILVLVGLLAITAGGFALKSTPDFGMGAELTNVNFGTVGAMLTVHIPLIPLFIGIGGDFFGGLSGGMELTSTLDFWLLHNPIGGGFISWYLGLGAYGVLGINPIWYALGVRLPIGLQIWPMDSERLEVFLELAPAWVPLYGGSFDPFKFQAQVALGARIWWEVGK
jgi:hypothetical protein